MPGGPPCLCLCLCSSLSALGGPLRERRRGNNKQTSAFTHRLRNRICAKRERSLWAHDRSGIRGGPVPSTECFGNATRRSDRELTCRAGVLLPEVASSSSLINDRRVRLSVQVYFVLLVARERLCRGWLGTCRERGIREGRGREGKFLLANAEGRARRFEPVAVAWGDIFRIRSRCSRSSTHGTVLRSHVVKNFTRVHSEALLRGSAASPGEIIGLFALKTQPHCVTIISCTGVPVWKKGPRRKI